MTAEHDRKTGRPPRYWRDMDDEAWKKAEKAMIKQVAAMDTLIRPNLMRQYVWYFGERRVGRPIRTPRSGVRPGSPG